ncbi:MAG: DUF86 domain-containing protein [Bacteroidota bacterium]
MPDKFGDKIRLQHAHDAIETIMAYIHDANFTTFSQNQMLRDACLRQIQVIGESCRNLSLEIRSKYTDVPWREIIGLRIIVIHEYFGVDEIVVWEIMQNDLPDFKVRLSEIIETL